MTNVLGKKGAQPLLGMHVSAAGGVYKAVENGQSRGARCIQIFGASPRQWHATVHPPELVARFKEAQKESDIEEVYLHAPYLINLAAAPGELREKSVQCLQTHLAIGAALGAVGVVFHVLPAGETTRQQAIERTAAGMSMVLEKVPGKIKLLMENNAGNPSRFGSRLEDLAAIAKEVGSMNAAHLPRVGVCLDTAHCFESGLIKEYSKQEVKDFVDRVDTTIGLANLVAMHVNDSKTKSESFHDRHENLGKGYIGLAGFQNLAKEKRLHHAAWLLEVPGFDGTGPDKENLDILKGCF